MLYWILGNLHYNEKDNVAMKLIHYITRNFFFAFPKDFQHVMLFLNVFENGYIVYSLKSVSILTECISDHNVANQRNN